MKVIASLLALLPLLVVSCGSSSAPPSASGGGGGATSVTVELSDFKVQPSAASVKAGKVDFQIRNTASMIHELKVIKTDLPEDNLPIDSATAQAKEDGKIGSMDNIPAGAIRTLSIDLAAGKYVLICNVAGHYQLGMHAAFKVE